METQRLDAREAGEKADATLASLFAGWRDPVLWRTTPAGEVMREEGVPLRAMVAYLFGEVAKNFHTVHHPEDWIEGVTLSQRGDRSVEIDPAQLHPGGGAVGVRLDRYDALMQLIQRLRAVR
jgi:hypothetical protein